MMTQSLKSQSSKNERLHISYDEFVSELKRCVNDLATDLGNQSTELESVRNYITTYTLERDNLVKEKVKLEDHILSLEEESRIKKNAVDDLLRQEQDVLSRITILDKKHRDLVLKSNEVHGEIEKAMEDIANRIKAIEQREESLRIRENIITSREKKIQSYTAFSNL